MKIQISYSTILTYRHTLHTDFLHSLCLLGKQKDLTALIIILHESVCMYCAVHCDGVLTVRKITNLKNPLKAFTTSDPLQVMMERHAQCSGYLSLESKKRFGLKNSIYIHSLEQTAACNNLQCSQHLCLPTLLPKYTPKHRHIPPLNDCVTAGICHPNMNPPYWLQSCFLW